MKNSSRTNFRRKTRWAGVGVTAASALFLFANQSSSVQAAATDTTTEQTVEPTATSSTNTATAQTNTSTSSPATTESASQSATLDQTTSATTDANSSAKTTAATTETSNSDTTTAAEAGTVYTDKDAYNTAMDTYQQEAADYQNKLNAKNDAEVQNKQIDHENATITQQNNEAIQNYHVDENVYQQKLTEYQTALDQYNADTQTNATTVSDYAQQIATYQAQLAQYQQDEQDWQETANTINTQNAANDAQYQAALADYNEAMTQYNSELQAVKDATDARLATAASNAEKLAIYAAAIGEYTTAKKNYAADLDKYNAAVAAQQTVINHNAALENDYNAAVTDYHNKLAAYKVAETLWTTTKNTAAQITAENQAKKATYETALAKYQADLAAYQAAEAEYQTAMDEYNNQVSDRDDVLAANLQAVADFAKAEGQYYTDHQAYLTAKAAYDATMQEIADTTAANDQAQAAYQLKYDDYLQALHVYNASKATYDQDKVTYDTNEPIYQTALTEEHNAQAVVDTANTNSDAVATASQTLTDLLADPKPADTDWQAAVQTAFNNLTTLSTAASDALQDLQEKVNGYQAALDNIASPDQPDALTSSQTATELAEYVAAVTGLQQTLAETQQAASQNKTNYEAGTAVNTSSAVLTTATQDLNAQLAAVNSAIDMKNPANMTAALNDAVAAKQVYDDALADYNTAVQDYRTLNSTAAITKLVAPADTDWTDFQQAVTNQTDLLEKFNAAQVAFANFLPELTATQNSVADFNQAINAYNAVINAQSTALASDPMQNTDTFVSDQQAAAKQVTDAQAALQATLTSTINDDLQTYLDTANAYQTAINAYQDAYPTANVPTPAVDLAALTDTQNQLNALQTAVNEDVTTTLTANQEMLTIPALNNVYDALQAKIDAINAAAAAQAAATEAWNAKVAEAQADGRWALFFNGDDGLLALANQLTEANYKYADAVNGTTTTSKVETITDEPTGKTFDLTVKDTVTAGPDASLADVMAQYQDAVDQYNATHSQQLPDAQMALGGIDAAMLGSDFDTDNIALMSKVENMLTQIGKLVADPAQNKIVMDRLDATSETFSGTTDGSDEPVTNPNKATAQISSYLTLLIGESDYTTLSTHTVNSASADIGNYTAGVSTTIFDYGPDVTGPNGVVKTTLSDQQDVLERFWNAEYTDIPAQFAAMNAGQPMPATATITGIPMKLTLDDTDYYLAAYSILAQNNAMMQVSKTTEVYTFETADPKAEFEANPLWMQANKNNNMRLFFYFMPVSALPASFDVEATPATPLAINFTPPQIDLTTLDDMAVPTEASAPTSFEPTEVELPEYTDGETVIPEYNAMTPNFGQLPKLALNSPVAPNNPGEAPQEPDAPTPPTLEEVPTTPVAPKDVTPPTALILPLVPAMPVAPEAPQPVEPEPAQPELERVPNVPDEPNQPEEPETPPYDEVPNLPDKPTPPTEPAKPELEQSPNIPEIPTPPTPPASEPATPLPPEPVKPVQPTPPDLTKTNKPTAPVPPTLTLLPPRPYTTVPDTPVPPVKPLYEEPNEPNTPDNPEAPNEPNSPDNPEAPNEPNTPDHPEAPNEPNTPDNPEAPNEPNTPDDPEVPSEPNTPANPEVPGESTPSATRTSNKPGQSDQFTIAGTTRSEAGTLPQTGESNTPTTLLGLLLLGVTSLFGFKGKRRQD